jgi:NAD-dependent SIR2 family protein deacetylase
LWCLFRQDLGVIRAWIQGDYRMSQLDPVSLDQAASVIAGADALIIAAGAGLGVDSGLPDFRGDQGFWKAYPPFERLRLRFVDAANPRWFQSDPHLAWGFYGHRLRLYAQTTPHIGFDLLRRWGQSRPGGLFVVTSNVDGQFERAGFDSHLVYEIHGSIHHGQCVRNDCGAGLFRLDPACLTIDESTFRAQDPLPSCPACGALARPNVLMFGDWGWDSSRSEAQARRFARWCEQHRSARRQRLVIVECGAGTAVPTIRHLSESLLAQTPEASLVRINLRESHGPPGTIGLAAGACEALTAIQERLCAR